MKNAMMKSVVLGMSLVSIASVVSGCNGVEAVSVKKAYAATTDNTGSGGCKISTISGGGQILCSDGSPLPIYNGAVGAQGPVGPAGPAGAAGSAGANGQQFVLRMGNGVNAGTAIISYVPTQNYTLYDDADQTVAVYNAGNGGILAQNTLYFTDVSCSGVPYVDRFQPKGNLTQNYLGALYRNSGNAVTTTVVAYKSLAVNCTVMGSVTNTFQSTAAYTGGLPSTLVMPVTMLKQ
jgi:hypothetical protein